MKPAYARNIRSRRSIVLVAVFVSALAGHSSAAQELVTYPTQEVAFICGPQLRSNSPLNPYPWFDSTATNKGASVAAALPAKAPRPLTGTVSVNTNSTIVTGNGTRFLAEIDPNGPAPFYNGRLRIRDVNYATRINIYDPGSGYTSTPTVTITPAPNDGGFGATAFAVISGGKVVDVVLTSGGTNYNQVPTVTFSGGNPTSPARANAAVSNGAVVGNGMRSVQVSSVQDNTHLTLSTPWSYPSVTAVLADTYYYHQETLNFNDFERGGYYDTTLTMYINYYRTNDPAFLAHARKLADAWWGQEGINYGTVVGGPTDKPPFTMAYAGLMLRALDGKPEYWDYIYRQVRAKFDHYVKIRRDYPMLYLDIRDAGYAQLYAVMLARVLPNSYSLYGNGTLSASTGTATDGAQKRAALLADVEDLAVNYFGRLQKPDGSWRWDTVGQERNVEQPFMVGLYLESVILLHQLTANSSVKTNLVNQLTNSVRHLHNDTYQKNQPVTNFPPYKWRALFYYWGGGTVAQPNLYNPPAPFTTACGLSQCGEDSVAVARQLNSTIHHAFGYAYVVTGDSQYRTMGDEIFGASFGDSTDTIRNIAADAGGKEYAMNYRASGRYLAWRLANPTNPSNQPITWTEVAFAATEADGGLTTTTLNNMATAVATQQLTDGKYWEFVPNNVSGNTQYRINTVGNRDVYRRISIGGGNLALYDTSGAFKAETTVTTSSVIRVSLEGTSLKIYKDGTHVYTFTDTLSAPLEFRLFIWVTESNLGAGLSSASFSSPSVPSSQPITWTEVAYATPEADGGIATTTLESPAHAAAVQQLTDGKYIEIVPNQVAGNSQYRINTVGNRNLYRRLSIGGGYLHFYNTSGAWQAETTVTTSSVIRISLEGTSLKIYKDGMPVYTFTDTLNGPFEFRMSFWVENTNLGAGLTSAYINSSSPPPVTWTEVAYAATEADGGLTTTTLNNMATAVAVPQLTAGKYLEIIPNNVSGNTQYRINTVGNRDVYRRISIGGGNLALYDTSGAFKAETTVTTASVIRISLEGTSLKIYKDGTPVYTFTDTLNAPLEFRLFIWVTESNLGAGLTRASTGP